MVSTWSPPEISGRLEQMLQATLTTAAKSIPTFLGASKSINPGQVEDLTPIKEKAVPRPCTVPDFGILDT